MFPKANLGVTLFLGYSSLVKYYELKTRKGQSYGHGHGPIKISLFAFRAQFRIHLFSQIFFLIEEELATALISKLHNFILIYFYTHTSSGVWYWWIFRNKSIQWLLCFWLLSRFNLLTAKNNTGENMPNIF